MLKTIFAINAIYSKNTVKNIWIWKHLISNVNEYSSIFLISNSTTLMAK